MSRIGNVGGRLYRGEVSFDFVGRQKLWYAISGLILVLSLVGLFARGLNFTVDFKGAGIEQVVQYLSNATKQPIMLDRAALSEAQISYDTPVTVKLDGVALRTVLKRILSDLGNECGAGG